MTDLPDVKFRSMFKHQDSYRLMWYECEVCGRRERVWNSRDAVSPFSIPCTTLACNENTMGAMVHVDWNRDQVMPNYDPPPGSRYFADFTRERAMEVATKRIASFDGTEFEIPHGTDDYHRMFARLVKEMLEEECNMDLLTVPEVQLTVEGIKRYMEWVDTVGKRALVSSPLNHFVSGPDVPYVTVRDIIEFLLREAKHDGPGEGKD